MDALDRLPATLHERASVLALEAARRVDAAIWDLLALDDPAPWVALCHHGLELRSICASTEDDYERLCAASLRAMDGGERVELRRDGQWRMQPGRA